MSCLHRAKLPETCKHCYRNAHRPKTPTYPHPVSDLYKAEFTSLARRFRRQLLTKTEYKRLLYLLRRFKEFTL